MCFQPSSSPLALDPLQVESDYSDEEAENAKRAAKKVPDWANKENIRGALAKQAEGELDPDKIFFEVRPIPSLPSLLSSLL